MTKPTTAIDATALGNRTIGPRDCIEYSFEWAVVSAHPLQRLPRGDVLRIAAAARERMAPLAQQYTGEVAVPFTLAVLASSLQEVARGMEREGLIGAIVCAIDMPAPGAVWVRWRPAPAVPQ